jgi:hypothetical protein
MAEALATPLLVVPEVGEALAAAFPEAAELELDVAPELALECGPQPATARAAAAMAAAKTAGLHDMKLDRFIVRCLGSRVRHGVCCAGSVGVAAGRDAACSASRG